MSDQPDFSEELAPAAVAEVPAAPTSFGARLRWERERAGLSVSDVASRLRLHVNQVRALEDESLQALPEAAYVRGFVRSYARVLNLDPAPLLADYGARLAPAASVVEGMTQSRDYSPVRAAAREQASRRIVLAGAILLLVALGALGWYATRLRPAPAEPVPAALPAPAPATAPPAAAAPAAAAPTVLTAAADAPVVAIPTSPAPALLEPVAPPPLLKLKFSGPSWAEVKDAEGKVLHSQQNVAGTEFVIEGTPPFYVVIGDTGKAAVEVRGETYDMTSVTRQNVARFTIN